MKGDKRTTEYRSWKPWLEKAASIASHFSEHVPGDDPFAYNETASASLLTSAAAAAGYPALAEFGTIKLHPLDRRRKSGGRSDFWMLTGELSWAFEFKQITRTRLTEASLKEKMEAAVRCAQCITREDADRAIAGVIVSLYWIDDADEKLAASGRLDSFASAQQFGWRIRARTIDCWIFFNRVR